MGRLDQVQLGIAALTLVFLGLATLRALALARRVSAPIEALSHNSDRIALGDLTAGEPILSPIREVERLVESQERMREAIGALIKLGRDLELAREIQQQTLPEVLPELEGIAIAAWSEPAEQTGGDSYDVIGFDRLEAGRARRLTQGPARHALCLLADATGHGVGPALSVTQVRSMLRMALRAGVEQRWALRNLSLQLAQDLPPGRFVTTWLGVLDADEKTLTGFSAGQAPLYLYRASGGSIEELAANAPPLGLLEEEDLELPAPFVLEPGDLFAVFSDGILDRENPGGDTFGEARVRDLLVREAPRGVDRVLEALRRALADFASGTPPRDDQTALLIQREA